MAASKMMTLRIEPQLLKRLRDEARTHGRSLSAQVVFLVRRELEVAPASRSSKPLPTMGWLRHLDAPDSLVAFRRLRRSLSRSFAKRVQRTATSR